MSRENIRACEGKFKSPSGEGSTDATVPVRGGGDWTALVSCHADGSQGTVFPPRLSHLILQQPCEVGRD